MAIIALMTDFGTADHYVPAMKGVILQIDPEARIVDISHDIASQDLYHGAFVLRQTILFFPEKTIFVAVVDPTVGSERRILAARYNNRVVIAPDNGLLSLLHRDAQLQEIRVVQQRKLFASHLSNTFHGRDVFAPVAAHLSRGLALDQVGPPAEQIEVLELSTPSFGPNHEIHGEVVLVDHFGNVITNISVADLNQMRISHRDLRVSVGALDVGAILTTYADASVGEALALVGSTDMLEIAVNTGNAAKKLNVQRGDPVHVKPSNLPFSRAGSGLTHQRRAE